MRHVVKTPYEGIIKELYSLLIGGLLGFMSCKEFGHGLLVGSAERFWALSLCTVGMQVLQSWP